VTINAAPSLFAGSTFAPTPMMTDSPAFTADTAYPQLLGSIRIAGSHFDPNTLTSKASPSPTLTRAARPLMAGPSPAPLDSPTFGVNRASSRRTGLGRSSQRSPSVTTVDTTVDTTAAVGRTPLNHSVHVIPGQYKEICA